MLRRMLRHPLYIYFTEDHWAFTDVKPRLRHHIKILMAATQLKRHDEKFHPGYYEVKLQMVQKRPMLVFLPVR